MSTNMSRHELKSETNIDTKYYSQNGEQKRFKKIQKRIRFNKYYKLNFKNYLHVIPTTFNIVVHTNIK